MCVAHLLHVLHELHRHLAIREGLSHGTAHPAFQMHFVNGHGGFQQVGLAAGLHPRPVLPLISRVVPDEGRGFRRSFAVEGIRIGLELLVSVVARSHVVLISRALAESGDEDLPDAAVAAAHRMPAHVPIVELTGYRHVLRVGRPDREAHAARAIYGDRMSAERAPPFVQSALRMEIEIGIGDLGTVPVSVLELHFAPVPKPRTKPIRRRIAVQAGHEESLLVPPGHLAAASVRHYKRRVRLRKERAYFPARLPVLSAHRMRSEDAERIAMIAVDYRFDFFAGHESLIAVWPISSGKCPKRSCICIWKVPYSPRPSMSSTPRPLSRSSADSMNTRISTPFCGPLAQSESGCADPTTTH